MILYPETVKKYGTIPENLPWKSNLCMQCDYCGVFFERKKVNCRDHTGKIVYDCKQSCGENFCKKSKLTETTNRLYGEDCFKKQFLDKSKKTFMEKYGVENAMELQEVRDKIKSTCLKKYGKESYLGTEECIKKTKETSIEKYGTDHPTQSELVKNKAKSTIIEKYGGAFQSTDKWKEKVKKTIMEKYGVENAGLIPAAIEKSKKTSLLRYGFIYPRQNKAIQDLAEATCLSRHGVKNYSQSPDYRDKYENTSIERYGTPHPMSSDVIKNKSLQTRIDKYGTLTPNLGKEEAKMREWLNSLGGNFPPNISLLNGKEIDMLDENKKIGVEYCGLFWHSDAGPHPRSNNYHFQKYKKCAEAGVHLFTIFEDEWLKKQEICKSILKSNLGIYEKRFQARKCQIVEVPYSIASKFYEQNHLLGSPKRASVSFGLECEKDLIGVITASKHHRNSQEHVLSRLCFSLNSQVIGGSARLISRLRTWCEENKIEKLISWSDNRWYTGNVYAANNFILDRNLPPDYSYFNSKKKHTRVSKQSQKKSKTGCPEDKTEKEWAELQGLFRIWDCGKKRWVLHI